MKKLYNIFLLITLFIIFTISVSAQFVRINLEFADIRVRILPETESIMVGEAFKDDIFKYISEENDWIEIEMFSGDARYIHRSLVEIFTHGVSAPFSNDVCLKLMERLEAAKERSLTEPDVKSQNVLFDRYVLDIFHEFGLQPVVFKLAVNRCSEGPESKIGQRPSEIEADYTLGAPIEKTELKKEVISERKPKITNESQYDFRKTKWGMSKEQVKEIEKNILLIGEDTMQDSIEGCDGSLHYKGEVNGLKCDIYYYFMKNRLISATYEKVGSISLREEYINNYENLKGYLIKKCGRLYDDGIEMIKDEPIEPFAMLFWKNPTDSIYQIFLSLMTFEDKAQIEWLINYQSEEGKNIKQNMADYTEKEETKKEVETQTETPKKELENQPKAEIKFIDSTNRLSGSGNYYYVEGILKNIGKGYAYHLRVKIQALDKYGKLVSIDECYADPSTLAPNKEATYQAMVNYNSKIDKFSKTVYWRNTY